VVDEAEAAAAAAAAAALSWNEIGGQFLISSLWAKFDARGKVGSQGWS
jgi:hypothetical protein